MATPLFLGAALAVAAVAALRLLAPVVDHYLLRDAVTVVARRRSTTTPTCAIAWRTPSDERAMGTVVDAQACAIQTRPAWRRITCEYAVPRKILPGWSRTLALPHRRRAALRRAGRGPPLTQARADYLPAIETRSTSKRSVEFAGIEPFAWLP